MRRHRRMHPQPLRKLPETRLAAGHRSRALSLLCAALEAARIVSGWHFLPLDSRLISPCPSIPHPRRTHAQPQEHRPRAAARPADRAHRTVGLGQVLARLRHDLRRGPTPLRRIAVGLRPAVPVDDGQARRGQHRGALAGHRHRAEVRPRTTRVPRSARSPRSTTTCACSTPAPASRAARITARSSRRRP